MATKTKREELFDLTDNIVEEILNMSEEEILSDLEEDGIIAEDEERAFDSLLKSAQMKAKQKADARACNEMAAKMTVSNTPILREQPNVTWEARNRRGGPVVDQEVPDYYPSSANVA